MATSETKNSSSVYKKRQIITSFNSRLNLVSGLSEPYLLIASAYVSLGKGFGSWTPLISVNTCSKHNFILKCLLTCNRDVSNVPNKRKGRNKKN